MKRRILSLLLVATFLMSIFMFCSTALAAGTANSDGLSAELSTDKSSYEAGEDIKASLTVTNGSDKVQNIRLELQMPDGLKLKTGTLVSDAFNLAVDSSKTENYVFYKEAPPTELKITGQPVSTTVNMGEKATVSVEAQGDGLTYAWYFKNRGMDKFNLTTTFTGSTYSVTMDAIREGRQVYCVITDVYGNSVTTDTVTLSARIGTLEITRQPVSTTVELGEKATVSVEAQGDGLTYKWYFKNPGMTKFNLTTTFTGNTYTATMDAARSGRQVYCVVSDAQGNKLTTHTVTLSARINTVEITKQPESVTVDSGAKATVSVEATGDGLTYKWYFKTPGMDKFNLTTTFTGNTYSVTMNETRSGRQVYCVITDAYGRSAKTETVTLGLTGTGTSQSVNSDVANAEGPAPTGDVRLVIFGALAVLSLAGLIVLAGGFKGLLKNRWFVFVLCFALLIPVLGPMAMAAEKDKTLDLSVEITVDGQPITLTATVIYDVADEFAGDSYITNGTQSLVFKQGGTALYQAIGEKGYYLASDISYNNQTTSKDGSYRPEVYAPYIEGLFGSYFGTTAKAGTLDATKFVAAQSEKKLLVGKTGEAASAAALELIDKNQWIITEIEGQLVVTGWYDSATAAAVNYLYKLSKDSNDVTLSLPIIGTRTYSHGNMPAFSAGTFLNGMDSDQGSVVLRYGDVQKADFEAYRQTLLNAGWTLYQTNTLEGYGDAQLLFATYVKGENAIHLQYLPASLPTVSPEDAAGFGSALYKAWEASYRSEDLEMRVILEPVSNLFPIDDPEDLDLSHVGGVAQQPALHVVNICNAYGDGNDVGALMIYTLADGSFFVWDGGLDSDATQLVKTLEMLNKRDDGIVIAGWVLTHAHNDHVGCFQYAANNYADKLTVEKVIVNRPADGYSWRGFSDPYGYAYGMHASFNQLYELSAKFGDNTQVIVPHMGQVMNIRNLNVETLASGEEDVFPVIINNDNAWSHVAKITYDGIDQTVMMLADSALDQTYNIFFPLMLDELDADIIQTAHHGLGGNTSRLYPIFNLNLENRIENAADRQHVAIWNTTRKSLISNGNKPIDGAGELTRLWTSMNKALRPDQGGYAVEDIVADTFVHTLPFPYTPGTVQKTYVSGFKSDFFDSENLKVLYLPDMSVADIKAALQDANADLVAIKGATGDLDALANVGYAYTYKLDAEGIAVLSRYPISKAESLPLGGNSIAHVLLSADGLSFDVFVGEYGENWAAIAAVAEDLVEGQYWVAFGDPGELGNSKQVALDGTVYALVCEDGEVSNISTTNCSFSLELSRYVLCTDLEVGEFDDKINVGQWWVNYRNMTTEKEQVIRWLLKNKHEIVGMIHVPDELLNPDGLAAFAELAGYPYYTYVTSTTMNGAPAAGHVLLSAYPIENAESILLRAPETEADSNSSTGYKEGRCYGHAVVDIPGFGKTDVYFGENDASTTANGGDVTNQRAVTEAAVSANAQQTNRPFILIGYHEGHITDTYAGQAIKVYKYGGSVIVVSNTLPMTGRATYGTKAIPVNNESPIGTTIANIDPYVKIDLVDIPEYQVTVTNGSGDKLSPAGATINITADAPAKGKAFDKWVVVSGPEVTFADANASKTSFVMPDGAVEVKATYKDVPVVEKDPTGETKDLKVAFMPAFRFKGEYANNAEAIVQNLLAQSGDALWQQNGAADILVLTLIDYDASCGFNSVDMFDTLKTAFTGVYDYAYFARGWQKGPEDASDPNKGYLGHMIFSKYEITSSESYILNTETSGEVRSAGRATVKIPGAGDTYTNLDVFFGHLGSGIGWESGETNLYEAVKSSQAEAWLVMGRTYLGSVGKTNMETKLNQSVTSAFNFSNIDIFGSSNLSYANTGTDRVLFDMFPYGTNDSYLDKVYFSTVTLPIYEAEGTTRYAVNVEGENKGYYAEGEEVTLTVPTLPAGNQFTGWVLPEGVTLTEGTLTSETIKFTMPAKILDITVESVYIPTVEVSFNANGGFGTMETLTVNAGESYALPRNEFLSPVGKKFSGWALTANGPILTDAAYVLNEDVTLYPVWVDDGGVSAGSWYVHQYGTANAAQVHATIKAMDMDLVILDRFTTGVASAADVAAACGYPYYHYSAQAVGETTGYGTLLLSKLPITDANHKFAVYSTTHTYNRVQMTIGGETVNVYYGQGPDGTNRAAGNTALAAAISTQYQLDGLRFVILGSVPDSEGVFAVKDAQGATVATSWQGQASYSYVLASAGFQSLTSSNSTITELADLKQIAINAGFANAEDLPKWTGKFVAVKLNILADYKVSFNANGGSGTMDDVTVFEGAYDLPECGFTAPEGYTFKGWATDAAGQNMVTTLNVTADTTVYAIWSNKLFDVTVNGNEVGQYETGDTVKVTAPFSAWGYRFGGWSDLDGVELKAGYTAAYMTIEFTMPERAVALTSDTISIPGSGLTYPTYVAPSGEMEELSVAYHWFGAGKKIADLTTMVNADKANDIIVGVNAYLTEAQLAQLAGECGYSYYLYSSAEPSLNQANILLSKYPFVHKDTMRWSGYNVNDYWRSFSVVELNVNGTLVDLCFGENDGGGGAGYLGRYNQTINYYASQATNPFILIGYDFDGTDVLPELNANRDENLYRNDTGAILYTTGVSRKSSTVEINHIVATLNIQKPAPTYSVSFNANGGSGEMAAVTGLSGEYTLPACTFTAPSGMAFQGWALDAEGENMVTTLTMDGNKTVYAIWKGGAYAVTVIGGSTEKAEYAIGETVTITADDPAAGKVFRLWDLTAGNVIFDRTKSSVSFTMPAEPVTVTATYRNKGEIKVAVLPASRFSSGYKDVAKRAEIDALLRALDADILAVTQLDQNVTNPNWYNSMDVPGTIAATLKDEYPYSYYAPAWFTSATNNDESTGHLILSKFEIKDYETIVLVEGTPYASDYTEGRSAGRIRVDVDGTTADVFFMHTGSAANWDVLAPKVLASTADTWIAMGYMNYVNLEYSGLSAKLGEFNAAFQHYAVTGGGYHWCNIISKLNAPITDPVRDVTTFAEYGPEYLYTATITLPKKGTVSFNANGGSGEMAAVPGQSGEYTLPGCTMIPPAGKQFAGWATSESGEAISGTTVTVDGDITLYAVWEAYSYPTFTAPGASDPKNTVSVIEWWGVGASKNLNATAQWLAQPANHVKLAALVHSKMTAQEAATLAADAGYQYYVYIPADNDVPIGHALLSDYPITLVDTLVLVADPGASGEGRSFGYAQVDVDGTVLDVYFGENNSGTVGKNQNLQTVEPWVYSHVKQSSNNYIVTGYNFGNDAAETFGNLNKTVSNSSGHILYCSGIIGANGGTKTAGLGGDEPVYVELSFLDKNPPAQTFTVTFNANGGEGTMDAVSGLSGNYTLPACTFSAPDGKQFKGWATDANGENMVTALTVDGNKTVYAIWEDVPNTIKVAVLPASRFGGNYKNATTAAQVNAALLNIDADVLAITQIDESVVYPNWWNNVDVATQITNALKEKYPYSYFAPAWTTVEGDDGAFGHLILSKYEIMEYETIVTAAGSSYTNNGGSYSGGAEGRGAGRVKLFYKGSTVDVFFTHMGAADEYNALVPAVQASTADCWVAVGNILYNSLGADAAAREAAIEANLGEDVNVGNNYGGINVISSGNAVMMLKGYSAFGYNTDQLVYATVQIPTKKDYTIMQWDVSAFGGSQTHKDATLPIIKNQNKDFVVLNGVQTGNLYGDTIEGLAEKMGYPYYHYAIANTAADGNSRGTLLLSKYPITVLDPIVLVENSNGASDAAEGRCFGHAQTYMGGKVVDIYYGETNGGTAYGESMTALLAKVNETYNQTGNRFLIMGYKFTDGDVTNGTYHVFKDAQNQTQNLYSYTAGSPGGGMILSSGFVKPTNGVTMQWFNKTNMYANAPGHYSHGVYGTITVE